MSDRRHCAWHSGVFAAKNPVELSRKPTGTPGFVARQRGPTDGDEAHVRYDALQDCEGLIALTGGADGAVDQGATFYFTV